MNMANKLRARIVQEHGYCLLEDEQLLRIYARDGGRSDSTEEIERWFRGELRVDAAEAPTSTLRIDANAPPEVVRLRAYLAARYPSEASKIAAVLPAALHSYAATRGWISAPAPVAATPTARRDAEPDRAPPVPAKPDPVRAAYDASWHANAAHLEGVERDRTERDLRSGGATFNDRAKAAYDASFRGQHSGGIGSGS